MNLEVEIVDVNYDEWGYYTNVEEFNYLRVFLASSTNK